MQGLTPRDNKEEPDTERDRKAKELTNKSILKTNAHKPPGTKVKIAESEYDDDQDSRTPNMLSQMTKISQDKAECEYCAVTGFKDAKKHDERSCPKLKKKILQATTSKSIQEDDLSPQNSKTPMSNAMFTVPRQKTTGLSYLHSQSNLHAIVSQGTNDASQSLHSNDT
jgi:hypothetical protein